MTKALVVLSGGADSTICLGWALARYDEVGCVTFNYGQRHAIELEAAARVVVHFERYYGRTIPHEVVDLGAGILGGTSPLTDKAAPLETYDNHDTMEAIIGDRVEKTFVPMRNALFLVVAANRAVVGGYDTLVTGVCQSDNANYPDCTEKFIDRMEMAIQTGLAKELIIRTPLMHMGKADSVRLALSLPTTYAALAFSHTAYDGQYPPTGKDHASVLRAHGFEQAGKPDPLVLRAVWEGKMKLPSTENYSERLVTAFTHQMFKDWGKPAA